MEYKLVLYRTGFLCPECRSPVSSSRIGELLYLIRNKLKLSPLKQGKNKKSKNVFSRRYTGYLPSNLDLDNKLLQYPIQVTYKKDKPQEIRNNLVYLLSVLYYQILSGNNDLNELPTDRYYHLCSEYLKPIIHNYKQYIQWLLDAGILETAGSWSKNYSCNGYRFKAKYLKGLIEPRQEFIYDQKLHEKLKPFSVPAIVTTKYNYLYKWFDSLEIDTAIAIEIIEKEFTTESKKQYHKTRLVNLSYKDQMSFSVGTTGRLYTPITNLHKKLRPCLRVNGSCLVETDIKSSIPFISTLLFDEKFRDKHEDVFSSINLSISNHIDFFKGSFEYHFMSLKKGKVVLLNNDKPDIEQYINDVRSDDVYAKMMDKWNNELGTSYTRKTAKKKLLTILNSPSYIKCPEKTVLASEYPSVIRFIDDINGRFKLSNHRSKNKDEVAPFAALTQTLESKFILDTVCYRISQEYPHVPVYTIHDSILTTPKYEELVAKIMKEEGTTYFGRELKLNTDY